MNKIKACITGLQSSVRKFVKCIFYIIGTITFGYAIWYAVKNVRNGHSFLVNFIAGIISGVLKVLGPAISIADTPDSTEHRC